MGLGSRQKEACCMTFQILELRAQITIDLHFFTRQHCNSMPIKDDKSLKNKAINIIGNRL